MMFVLVFALEPSLEHRKMPTHFRDCGKQARTRMGAQMGDGIKFFSAPNRAAFPSTDMATYVRTYYRREALPRKARRTCTSPRPRKRGRLTQAPRAPALGARRVPGQPELPRVLGAQAPKESRTIWIVRAAAVALCIRKL